MEFQDLILEKEKGVALITLNRPEKLNAISNNLRREMIRAFELVRNDDEIRVLVFTGAGRGFCSGADVGRQQDRIKGVKQEVSQTEILSPVGYQGYAFMELDKPTIAAVNGVAAGGGLSLAMLCDIRIASENARFAWSFIRRGLIADTGATFTTPRLLGLSRAFELMYTGDIIDAREAERLGLVSRVVPHEDLMKEVLILANRIAQGPPIALRLTKRAILRGLEGTLQSAFFYESYAQGVCRNTEDHKEGVTAFMEKRDPVFRGT